jgi:microcystin-dependent protein
MDPFLGMIVGFGGNFAPRGWAFCEGQLLSINENTALFSILGTTYGGDGRTTFALPDLRGRQAIQQGNGPGLPSHSLGQKGGRASITLTQAEMPAHTHVTTIHAETAAAAQNNPQGRMLAGGPFYADVVAAEDRTLAPQTVNVANTGSGQQFDSMNPYLAINFIIALQGTFPSRS